ncbi:hypothetical protein JHK87_033395 [Glycine soja]|nr:hypothetical protein JHK87_033395 [Glycine soja]
MGCGGSKVEDFPAVVLCRERKAFLKAASEQRYALAAAHVAYFHSLSEIGDALHKFAEQDLTTTTSSSSPLPAHWKVPWFEVKWHVKQYKKEKHMDPNLLELAKLNFNLIHAKLQMEVKELSSLLGGLRLLPNWPYHCHGTAHNTMQSKLGKI